jgi:RHS repeat-associated protein
VQSLSYTYNAAGYLATASDGAPAPWGFDLSYDYDPQGRLASVTGGSELPYALSLAYTPVGGLESKNDLSYGYDELPHAPTTVGGSSLTYDDNGNRATLSAGGIVTTYTYNEANHLTQVLTASGSLTGTVHYLYTATSRSASSGDGALALRVRDECDYTLYVGDRHEERGLVTTVDGDPPWEACDAQQTSYFYASGQAVALRTTHPYEEEPYRWEITSTVYYLHHDLAGNLTEVTDKDGEIVGRARYNALGEVLSSTIPPTITGRLSGGQLDSDAGLVYDGAGRFYDPVLGLYLQPDPFGGAPEAPGSLNRYAAPGVSTLPTLGSVPTGGANRARQRSVINLTTDVEFLSEAKWWSQQTFGQGLVYLTERLTGYSLVRFTVRASRHKLLTRLPQAAIELLGGRGVIQDLPANRTMHTMRAGLRLTRQALSRSLFDDFSRVIAGDGRSTRWAGTVDDFAGYDLSWWGGWRFGLGAAVGVDVLVQWFWPGSGDVWNYTKYGLTPAQFAGRTLVSAGGGAISFGGVALLGIAVFGGPMEVPFLLGAAVFIGIEAAYEATLKPWLYEKLDLFGRNEGP